MIKETSKQMSKQKFCQGISFSNYKKIKHKEKILKEVRRKKITRHAHSLKDPHTNSSENQCKNTGIKRTGPQVKGTPLLILKQLQWRQEQFGIPSGDWDTGESHYFANALLAGAIFKIPFWLISVRRYALLRALLVLATWLGMTHHWQRDNPSH